VVFNVIVPPPDPPDLYEVFDMSSDTRQATFNPADDCAYRTDDGWYHAWTTDNCAMMTFNFCCTEPYMTPVQQVLVDGCPCSGPTNYILPNPGRSGYGDACGNNYCCEDGNYSVEWTARAGTYHYSPIAGSYCEQSGDACVDASECLPGEGCVNRKQAYQAHLYVEPCRRAACCVGDVCYGPDRIDGPEPDPSDVSVEWKGIPKYECEDFGGVWLGDLVPQPVEDCSESGDPPVGPCVDGACCLPGGGCRPDDGTKMTLSDCETVHNGEFSGGVICANSPCAVCEFEDPAHCQLDTGQYIFPSDRQQGTRRADDFRVPLSGRQPGAVTSIVRICFEFGFITDNPPPECSDDPPRENFEVHFYEDDNGFPGAELSDSVDADFELEKAEPKGVGLRTWRFSGTVNGDDGIAVTEGECYWISITGMGTDCQTLWVHSRDGNNYGLRDDNDTWGEEDIRDSDVVFCIDTGIVRGVNPPIDGGCGPIPVACCFRSRDCIQISYAQCTTWGGYPVVNGICFECEGSGLACDPDAGGPPDGDCAPGTGPCVLTCPFPDNDRCYVPLDPENPDPDRPPNNAEVICAGTQETAPACSGEPGQWCYYDGETPETRLGICEKWDGWPAGPVDFGQVCHPLDQTTCTDPPNIPYTNNMCYPWGYDPAGSDFERAYECYADVDNRLASTDGPEAGGDCFGSGVNSFKADVWYTITAPCRGHIQIGMCTAESEYDSMLAVFGDHTRVPRCPTTGPDNEDLLYCNDDYCMGSGTASGIKWDMAYNEETEVGAVYILRLGGWSAVGADSDAGQGWSQLHIGAYCEPERLFDPPVPAGTRSCTINSDCDIPAGDFGALPGTCNTGVCYPGKSRYLSIDPDTNPTRDTVIKVEVAEMRRCENAPTRACLIDLDCDAVCDDEGTMCGEKPDQYPCIPYTLKCPPKECSETDPPSNCIWSGPCVDLAPSFYPPLAWVVQQPTIDPTGGCKKPGCPPDYYPEAPHCCEPDDWMSYLGATVPSLTGGYTSWADVWAALPADVLHITDCAVVPATTYAIYACSPFDLDECSEPLLLSTAKFPYKARPIAFPLYGDVCGGTYTLSQDVVVVLPPDGYVSVKDLLVEKLTLMHYGSYALPQMHMTWADLHGAGTGIPPNYNLNISDLVAVYVFGLVVNHPHVNSLGGVDPQDCPNRIP
jgi:hypothetical protein